MSLSLEVSTVHAPWAHSEEAMQKILVHKLNFFVFMRRATLSYPVFLHKSMHPVIFQAREHTSLLVPHQPYLNSGWWALFTGGGGGKCCGGLDEGGRHLRWHWGGGACCTPTCWHITHKPHTAVHFNVGVTLGSHVEDFEAVIVETGELALVGSLPVVPADGDSGLGVEDCQLPAWRGMEGTILIFLWWKIIIGLSKRLLKEFWHASLFTARQMHLQKTSTKTK